MTPVLFFLSGSAGPTTAPVRRSKKYIQSAEEAMAVGSAWHYVILLWSGRLVGRVGLTTIDLINSSAELGYMLRTDAESNGVMTEAAHGLLSYAFGPGKLHRITAFADFENEKSQRLLTRLGFQQEGIVRHMTRHPERGWRDHYFVQPFRGRAAWLT